MMNPQEYTIMYIEDETGLDLNDDGGHINLDAVLPLPDSLPDLNFDGKFELCEPSGSVMPRRGPPDRVPFPGKYDFHVEINSTHTNTKKYVLSHKLNRIYVELGMDFPVQFQWSGPADMFVRAACVFADAAQAQKRVERCIQHYHTHPPNAPADPAVKALNVLHSSRPRDTADVHYEGDASAQDSWLSVRVALHKAGLEPAAHAYRFACKNSCTSGINRRAILIIFTLEDQNGIIHGRQLVGARVCACPRRDMLKDEESEAAPRAKKRRLPPPPPLPARVKNEEMSPDNAVIDLSLLHPQAAVTGLEVMIKMEEQAPEPRRSDVIARLKQIQEELKRKHNIQ